jgi:hypothetical protein
MAGAFRLPALAGAKAQRYQNGQFAGPTEVVPLLQNAFFNHFSASLKVALFHKTCGGRGNRESGRGVER